MPPYERARSVDRRGRRERGGVKAASESGTARPPPYRTATAPTAARTRSAASLAGTTSLARLHVGIGPVEIVAVLRGRDRVAEGDACHHGAGAGRERCLVGNAPLGCLFQVPAQEGGHFLAKCGRDRGVGERILKEDLIDQRCDDVGRVAHNRDGAVEVGLLADGLGDPKIGDLNPTS